MQFCTRAWASASAYALCAKKSAKSRAVGMFTLKFSINSMCLSSAANICTVNLSLERLLDKLPLFDESCWVPIGMLFLPCRVAMRDYWESIEEFAAWLFTLMFSIMFTHSSSDKTRSSLFLIAISIAIIAISLMKQLITFLFFARYPSRKAIAYSIVWSSKSNRIPNWIIICTTSLI